MTELLIAVGMVMVLIGVGGMVGMNHYTWRVNREIRRARRELRRHDRHDRLKRMGS